ncbi:MAG TPA: peptidase T [Candidatus Ornithospirochaeta stercorigallinarum]|nr:peptidase T [Candidatus Ornithospirochaeta stercorigallinarum]
MKDFREELLGNFIFYTRFDTMSIPAHVGIQRPTSEGQKELIKELESELKALGLSVEIEDNWALKGLLKGNKDGRCMAFMAHVDTSDDVMGNGVKAQVIEYEGGDISLPSGLVIKAEENPDLGCYVGTKIVTSDGTTLLGSDDKAGVAIIMSAIGYLARHPEVPHPDIEVYFTTDEETGAGMDGFPYDRMNACVCYTVDGSREGEIETECFNAATITVRVRGVSIHLGSARGVMVNALTILSQIASTLPQAESPEATDGRYGYYAPLDVRASAAEGEMQIFIRDHDEVAFNYRLDAVRKLVEAVAFIYKGKADVSVSVSYHNMADVNKKDPEAVEAIFAAARELGIDCYEEIIRGGTDGARIAECKGISAPNIFTGGHNLHSLSEWVSLEAMNKAANLVLRLAEGR